MKLFIYRHCFPKLEKGVIKGVVLADDRQEADRLFANIHFLYAKKFLNYRANSNSTDESGWLEVQETEMAENCIYC